jgi:hypothetical protein
MNEWLTLTAEDLTALCLWTIELEKAYESSNNRTYLVRRDTDGTPYVSLYGSGRLYPLYAKPVWTSRGKLVAEMATDWNPKLAEIQTCSLKAQPHEEQAS